MRKDAMHDVMHDVMDTMAVMDAMDAMAVHCRKALRMLHIPRKLKVPELLLFISSFVLWPRSSFPIANC